MPTAFVVEDIDIARRSLIHQLKTKFPELEILGEADGVVSALKQLNKLKPQILFLDIDLPDGTAFDILECLTYQDYKIIFTTASDQYAIRAFQVAAIDYILKPIDQELLKVAIERALKTVPTSSDQLELVKSNFETNSYSTKIAISTSEKIKLVDILTIVRCESSSNYTTFFFEDGTKEMVSKTLKEYEKILNPTLFLRTHQSHLVNFNFVKELVKRDGGYLLLKNEEMVPVSVRKRSAVVEQLSKT